jgi:hypothetical protein
MRWPARSTPPGTHPAAPSGTCAPTHRVRRSSAHRPGDARAARRDERAPARLGVLRAALNRHLGTRCQPGVAASRQEPVPAHEWTICSGTSSRRSRSPHPPSPAFSRSGSASARRANSRELRRDAKSRRYRASTALRRRPRSSTPSATLESTVAVRLRSQASLRRQGARVSERCQIPFSIFYRGARHDRGRRSGGGSAASGWRSTWPCFVPIEVRLDPLTRHPRIECYVATTPRPGRPRTLRGASPPPSCPPWLLNA